LAFAVLTEMKLDVPMFSLPAFDSAKFSVCHELIGYAAIWKMPVSVFGPFF
jgi:hypothetical protein